jgi:membrane protein
MLILALVGISALYRWGPSRERAKWRWITPGAVLAVVLIAIVSIIFSWYAANFSNYNATYGSLGALIGFLTWLWLTATIVITGAELNSELEHQTKRDSTTGTPLPLGERGAYMADHVAAVGKGAPASGKAEDRPAQADAPPARPADSRVALALAAVLIVVTAAGRRRVRRP